MTRRFRSSRSLESLFGSVLQRGRAAGPCMERIRCPGASAAQRRRRGISVEPRRQRTQSPSGAAYSGNHFTIGVGHESKIPFWSAAVCRRFPRRKPCPTRKREQAPALQISCAPSCLWRQQWSFHPKYRRGTILFLTTASLGFITAEATCLWNFRPDEKAGQAAQNQP